MVLLKVMVAMNLENLYFLRSYTGYLFAGWDGEGIDDKDSSSLAVQMDKDWPTKIEKIKKFFTTTGRFSVWINHLNHKQNDWLHTITASDKDVDAIAYSIDSGNPDFRCSFNVQTH